MFFFLKKIAKIWGKNFKEKKYKKTNAKNHCSNGEYATVVCEDSQPGIRLFEN